MSLGMNQARVRLEGKPLFYHSDGTGRDTYIVRNNGGLLSQALLKKLEFSGVRHEYSPMRIGLSPRPKNLIPNHGDKFVHYHSDGSGRDSYIGCNHGGRISNFSSKNNTENFFKQSLRAYEKMPNFSTPSSPSQTLATSSGFEFNNPSSYLSEKQMLLQSMMHCKQVKDSNRLAVPKRVVSPLKLPSIVSPRQVGNSLQNGTNDTIFSSQSEKNLKSIS